MHIKRMHEMIEKLTEYTQCAIEAGINSDSKINICDVGELVDMIKDLSEAEYKSLISKEMKEYKEEEEAEEKHMLKRFKEEYGEEDGEKRYYDDYRYKRTGRYAPKGRGSYMPRRGYEEPPYYHMMPEDYKEYPPEHWRDMDRMSGKMYYTDGNMGVNSGASGSRNGGSQSANMNSDNVRGYSDGYNDGYSEGERAGRSFQGRDRREGRSGQSRRSYMETKEMHKDGTAEDKQSRLKDLDSYMNELNEDMKELIKDMTPEERTMLKQKMAKLNTLI